MAEGGGGEPPEEDEERPMRGAWRRGARVRTHYKTVEEVVKEGGSLGARLSASAGAGVKVSDLTYQFFQVIDMTGREQKVYSGYDAFSMRVKWALITVSNSFRSEQSEPVSAAFDVPELRHNLNLIVDLTEEEIRRNDHQLKSLKVFFVSMQLVFI